MHIPPIPAVESSDPEIADLITDEENGLLVPARDVPALAASMQRIVLNPALRRRLTNAAPETSRVYSPTVQKEKLLAVYQSVFAS